MKTKRKGRSKSPHKNVNQNSKEKSSILRPSPDLTQSGSPDTQKMDQKIQDELTRLTPLELSLAMSQVVNNFLRIIVHYWTDEQGYGPLGRFLKFDRPIGGIGPTRRILLYGVMGFFLSIIALVVTEDEYYTGPKMAENQVNETSDFYPVYISFENLGCSIQNVGSIITNISGDARPGRLTGILGASGSGKTTLAHALLGRARKTCTSSEGVVYLNGEPGSLDSFLDRVGFVPQDDVLYPEITVLETLQFSARYRLPRYFSDKNIENIVQETIKTLELTNVVDSFVGGPKKRGLSGGERKRVSIGVELVALPSVLVLDEPTSGLDGAQAHKLIGTLKEIASKFNVSVVTVIHQPSARSFNLFDDIILLQKGKLVYYGERSQAVEYFRSLNSLNEYFKQNNNDSLSPAEILLDVSTGFTELDSNFLNSDFFKRQQKSIRDRERQYKIFTKKLNETLHDEEAKLTRIDPIQICDAYKSELLRILCNIATGLANALGLTDREEIVLRYYKRPKRGILYQAYQWWFLLWTLTFRRGVKTEISSIIILACTCAYLRHFNRTWSRKQISAFYISVSLGLIAMMGAAFEDDILPVRRAVNSGMLLGAHEFALVFHSLNKGFFTSHLFGICYFSFKYILDPPASAIDKHREFVCTPFSWRTYLRFQHLLQINYYAARGFGLLMNVLVDHDEKKSLITSCAFLIGAHAFSLFTPQASQLVKDGLYIYGVNFSRPLLFLCSFSYVRYFLEAMFLWDPDPHDKIARDFVLRYYSYREGTEAACATTIVGFIVASQVVRFIVFAFRNANDYASLYDAPALIIFITKILVVYGVLLIFAVVFHEFVGIKRAWQASVSLALKNRNSTDDLLVPLQEKISLNDVIENQNNIQSKVREESSDDEDEEEAIENEEEG